MTDFSYRRIFIIGLGFFSISIVWQLYNSFMPLMLGNFIDSKMIRGMIMGLDNVANIFLIPIIGAWSDRIVNRGYGQRMPFLWVGMPLAALFLFVMPHYVNLWTLILIDIGFLLTMTLFRSPTVSLMPDVTPEAKRSQANGIINFMGGIGALITLFLLSPLYDMDKSMPFYIGGVVLLVVIVILTLYLRKLYASPSISASVHSESSSPTGPTEFTGSTETTASTETTPSKDLQINASPSEGDNVSSTTSKEPALKVLLFEIGQIFTDKDHLLIRYALLGIFFWFIAFSSVEAQFTTYGVEFLGLSEGVASLTLGFFSLSFIIFSIPSGSLAKKFGRTHVIQTGVIGMFLLFAVLFFLRDLTLIRSTMFICGLFCAFINIHIYPLIVRHAPEGGIGLYTGIYYIFSSVAAAVGPFLLGGVMDVFGYPALFIGAGLSLIATFWCMRKVRKGSQAAVKVSAIDRMQM